MFSAGSEGCLVAGAGDEAAGEVAVVVLGGADLGDGGCGDLAVGCGVGDGVAGGAEGDFPGVDGGGGGGGWGEDPGVAFGKVRGFVGFGGDGDFEVCGGGGDEFAEFDLGVFLVGEEEFGDVDSGEVHAVEGSVVVGAADEGFLPVFVVAAHEEGDFEVEVGAGAVDASAGVAHAAEDGACFDGVAGFAGDFREVGVEGVDGGVFPAVFDDEVFAVVAAAGDGAGVDDGAVGNAGDEVEGISGAVAFDGGDVDAFVEFGEEDLAVEADGCAGVAEGAAFPGFGGFALEGAIDVHVEAVGFSGEEVVVFGGEAQAEGVG